jgi:hypothetical protein
VKETVDLALKVQRPPSPAPVLSTDVSSDTQANYSAMFLRGAGTAKEDYICDNGYDLYLQTPYNLNKEQ